MRQPCLEKSLHYFPTKNKSFQNASEISKLKYLSFEKLHMTVIYILNDS